MKRPLPLTAQSKTAAVWLEREGRSVPGEISHTLSVPSLEAETITQQSPLTAQSSLTKLCSARVSRSGTVRTSHTLSVPSSEAETITRPSPLTAQLLI